MNAAGRLEDLGVAEMLYLAGASRRSGELLVDTRGQAIRVLFRDGRIVGLRHPRGTRSLAELAARLGVADEARMAVLERDAASSGRSVMELLEAGPGAGTIERPLAGEIERLVTSILDLKEGTFLFRLVADPSSLAPSYGGLVLRRGLEPERIAAVRRAHEKDGVHVLRASLPRSTSTRQATLLVPEESLRLPALRPAVLELDPQTEIEPDQDIEMTRVAPTAPEADRVAAVVLPAGSLRDAVLTSAAARGLEARVIEQWSEAQQALSQASRRDVALLAHVAHVLVPGLEVLALSRTIERSIQATVVLDGDLPPARLAVLAERGRNLGARHLVVAGTGRAAADATGRDLAALLVDLVLGGPPADAPGPPPTVPLPDGPGDGTLLAELVDEAPRGGPGTDVSSAARALLPSQDVADIALALLGGAGRVAPRAVLLLKFEDAVRAVGGFAPGGASVAEMLRGLVLPLDGDDFLSRAVRDGRSISGPPTYSSADRGVVSRLGRARHVALLPLVAGGTCHGALYVDDGGTDAAPRDLAQLATLVSEAAMPLHGARSAARRRAEALRSRLPA